MPEIQPFDDENIFDGIMKQIYLIFTSSNSLKLKYVKGNDKYNTIGQK